MKVGENPQRGESHDSIAVVRIFVIIYLPNLSGFFSNMEAILNRCLDSLERTVRPSLGRITLISNGSSSEIEQLLLARRSPVFDQIVINNTNLGKIDGLLSVARGALEDVVVVSDCDVLFTDGWLEEVLRVFSVFPEAASVSPIASPRRYVYETRTTLLGSLLRGELTLKSRMPREDFILMTEGSSNPEVQLRFIDGQVSVARNGYDAGIAGGHQCVAFRREMIQKLPTKPCLALLEPHADRDYLDRPPDVLGYWRLSTPTMMAHHMGNTPDKSLSDLNKNNTVVLPPTLPLPPMRRPWIAKLPYIVRRKLSYLIQLILERRIMRLNKSKAGSPHVATLSNGA